MTRVEELAAKARILEAMKLWASAAVLYTMAANHLAVQKLGRHAKPYRAAAKRCRANVQPF